MEPLEFIYDDVDPNNNNNEFILDEIQNINREFDLISFSNLFKEIKYETKSAIINLNEKSIEFITIKMQNHGRKRITELIGNKIHRSTDYDNILSKIQIHFFNFLVNFANDAIRTVITNNKERKKFEFKHIKHKDKIQISIAGLEKLIKKPISDILQLNISKKYRKLSLDEDYNKNIYNKVIDLSDWLKKLFDMNYLDAFKLYYNSCQPLECFEFEDKIIKFSKKTKSFFCLYNKAKNQKEKIRLKFIAGVYYLRLGNPTTFITEISAEL
jgi:hypothetical protein